jgi:recombinational DNA repair ATPase RecF
MSDPTVSELEHRLTELGDRITRERQEVLTEIRAGFADIQAAIRRQDANVINRAVYEADQRRLDIELAQLREEVTGLRRWFLLSFVGVSSVAILLRFVG